jgi:tetratricopeptide (TPR) repeat protein
LSARSHIVLGDIYFTRGEYAPAAEEYQKAIAIFPRLAEAHCKAGEAYLALEQYHQALMELRLSAFINPKSADPYALIGKVFFLSGYYDEAFIHYRSALDSNPNMPSALAGLGDVYTVRGEYAEAIAHYKSAMKMKGLDAESADRLTAERSYPEAVAACRTALGLGRLVLPGGAKAEVGDGDDRRKHRRLSLRFPAKVESADNRKHRAEILDISRHGMLLKSSEALEPGTELNVLVNLDHFNNDKEVIARGRIARMSKADDSSQYLLGVELVSSVSDMNADWGNFFVGLD